jgi:uncharacterized protein (DUF488 family)
VDAGGVLLTIGYEGRDLTELVDRLQSAQVTTVLDVRLTPSSRQPGFSKGRLAAGLAEGGIDYEHLPELGNPKDNRAGLRAGREGARARYQAQLEGPGRPVVDAIARRVREERLALLCFEREATSCHRSLVAAAVRAAAPSIDIEDL